MNDKILETLGIEKEYQELIDNRTILINKVLDKMTNWDEFFDYYQILRELLPVERWYNNMPNSLINHLNNTGDASRYELLYYNTICYWMDDINEDLLNEVKDYIRENMICGTSYDW